MRRDKTFTITMALPSIILIGGTIAWNWKRTTIEDVLYIVSPYIVLFFFWLFIRWLRKSTGVKRVPWLPPKAK